MDEVLSGLHQSFDHDISHPVVIYCQKNKVIKAAINQFFKKIIAGGGLIKNEDNAMLWIYRRGKWDLPKGKMDKGEKPKETARREVMEETGLKNPKLKELAAITHHAYIERNKWILKETYWFYMQASKKEKLVPEAREQIEMILWVQKEDIPKYVNKTFQSLQSLF